MKKGFTLLELLISSVIISFVSVIITQVLFSSIHLNTKTEVIKELKQTGEMTLGIISRMVQNAASVACTTATTLTITGVDGGSTTIASVSDAESGVMRVASNSSYISNSNVTLIEPLQFTCVDVGGVPNSVTISFRIRQKNVEATTYESATEVFQTTVNVRNTTK